MAEPRRAQNYIPISGKGKRPSDQQHYRTDGNLAVEIERRVQKAPANRETNAQKSAPRAKNLYNNRIEEMPGRKASGQQRGTSAAMQQRKAPVQQRTAMERQAMPKANAVREPARQPREAYARQKTTAQGYKSIMQGGHVSMRGEMAIPVPQTGIRIKPEKAKAPKAAVQAAPRPQGVVSTILLIVFVFGILSFLLMRNATISSISLENASLQKNITSLSQNLDKTKLDVTLQDDLSSIRDRAEQMNMGIPASGQINYLPEEDTAVAETQAASDTQTVDSSKDTSFSLNSLFKEIKSWFG